MKRKNIAQLGVDNLFSTPDQYGKGGSSNISIGRSLFIGGHPRSQTSKYLGCIRNIEVVDHMSNRHIIKKFPTQMVQGNVTLSVCPTI